MLFLIHHHFTTTGQRPPNVTLMLLFAICQIPFRGASRSLHLQHKVSFVALRGGKEFVKESNQSDVNVGVKIHDISPNRPKSNSTERIVFIHLNRGNTNHTANEKMIKPSFRTCKLLMRTNSSISSNRALSMNRRCSNCSRWAVFGASKTFDLRSYACANYRSPRRLVRAIESAL
jgi:hypothetical protein